MSLEGLPFALPEALERALREAYARPRRAYHDFDHVEEVLGRYAEVPRWERPVEVALALLFHDAIYEPGRDDNEARSAALARSLVPALAPGLEVDLARVEELILLTARHGQLEGAELDADAAHFLDCDMAILGASPERYDAYEAGIAEEHAHVPRSLYRRGRRRFLEHLLERPAIFHTSFFRARFEASARANLERAIASLR